MGEAVNSKKLLTKSYQTWRVIQAPGQWAQFYRDRIKQVGNYRSAIIFPEQLLGLNQKSIWTASGTISDKNMVVSVNRITSFSLQAQQDRGRKTLETVEQVYEFEAAYHDDLSALYLANANQVYNTPKFIDFKTLFTSKADAAKWACRYAERMVGEI